MAPPAGPVAVAPTMPARWGPLLYFAFAHASLAVAFAILAVTPRSLAGFFYHPRMVAVVHLVTLGWITASIMGAVFVVGPLAFRMPMPAGRADYAAFGLFAAGVMGMVAHFWVSRPLGTAWASVLVAMAMAHVAVRALTALRKAPVPLEARLAMGLSFANMGGAVLLGLLLAVNKRAPFLPVSHLDGVFAHAHLAAVGWGTMMVVAAGYRMLPMILPAAMPRGPAVWASVLLLQSGVVALVWSFLARGRGLGASATLTVAGIFTFLSRVVWMLRNRRPAPAERRRPDWGVAHALAALTHLLAACALGLHLSWAERSEVTLALASAYAVLGLLGFLAQMVVGVEARVLPLFGWLWGFADRGYAESPPSLHGVSVRWAQGLGFLLWNVGVPLLAFGLARERPAAISSGAAALLLALIGAALNGGIVLRRLWRVDDAQ